MVRFPPKVQIYDFFVRVSSDGKARGQKCVRTLVFWARECCGYEAFFVTLRRNEIPGRYR